MTQSHADLFRQLRVSVGSHEANAQVEGLHIRVDKASRPSKDGSSSGVEYDRARSVFVGNLAFDIEVTHAHSPSCWTAMSWHVEPS